MGLIKDIVNYAKSFTKNKEPSEYDSEDYSCGLVPGEFNAEIFKEEWDNGYEKIWYVAKMLDKEERFAAFSQAIDDNNTDQALMLIKEAKPNHIDGKYVGKVSDMDGYMKTMMVMKEILHKNEGVDTTVGLIEAIKSTNTYLYAKLHDNADRAKVQDSLWEDKKFNELKEYAEWLDEYFYVSDNNYVNFLSPQRIAEYQKDGVKSLTDVIERGKDKDMHNVKIVVDSIMMDRISNADVKGVVELIPYVNHRENHSMFLRAASDNAASDHWELNIEKVQGVHDVAHNGKKIIEKLMPFADVFNQLDVAVRNDFTDRIDELAEKIGPHEFVFNSLRNSYKSSNAETMHALASHVDAKRIDHVDLARAIQCQNEIAVEFVIPYCLQNEVHTSEWNNALINACETRMNGGDDYVSLIEPYVDNDHKLIAAALYGDVERMKELIPISNAEISDNLALHVSALNGNYECVKLLIPVSDVNSVKYSLEYENDRAFELINKAETDLLSERLSLSIDSEMEQAPSRKRRM
ncbi:hypothetical protein [Stenotrophomonas acidaminiphila]